jgi:hypothetical protein
MEESEKHLLGKTECRYRDIFNHDLEPGQLYASPLPIDFDAVNHGVRVA